VSEERDVEALDLPASVRDDKVVEGREGRLFLANDANRVLAQHSGELLFDEDQLRRWQELLDTRTEWLAGQGALHYFLIAPNAHSVYPDMLPEGVVSAKVRPVHQLIDRLRTHGSSTRVVYPLEALVLHRAHSYPKTGSHWNGFGAYVAAEALLDEIRRDVPLGPRATGSYGFVEIPFIGDLGAKLTPPATSSYIRPEPLAPRARLVSDNRVRNTGRRVVYESDMEEGLECLVYGDSFAMRTLQFLAESFRRLTFVHMVSLDRELVRELRPDVVVKIMNERFVIAVPVDDPAKTQAELEAERLAAGDVLPPQQQSPRPGRPLSLTL
jgi:alginate O-acetyltransferase complex protein AlgJ